MEKMCNEYYELVFKYLLTLTHDHDLAEELTQETFYRAIRKLKTFREDSKMSTWLCQIAKYTFYQYIDKSHRHPQVSIEDMTTELSMPTMSQPEDLYLQDENKLEIYKAIQNQPSPQRDVLMLRITGDLSFKEIGEILGKTENWARVTFYRGKQAVIKEVNGHGEDT